MLEMHRFLLIKGNMELIKLNQYHVMIANSDKLFTSTRIHTPSHIQHPDL